MDIHNIIYGIIPIVTCLKVKRRKIHKIFIQEGKNFPELTTWKKEIPVETKPKGFLDRVTKNALHQGIVAEVEPLPYFTYEEWIKQNQPPQDVVVLDHIEDPRNLGAILRSAVAFGLNTIILPQKGGAPITPVAVKTSAGAIEYTNIVYVNSILQTIRKMKEMGYCIYGLDANGRTPLNAIEWVEPSAIIIGSEGKGIRTLVKKECDYVVAIPTEKNINQLNASVSASIAFYQKYIKNLSKQL